MGGSEGFFFSAGGDSESAIKHGTWGYGAEESREKI
jgi:hypothetical protein